MEPSLGLFTNGREATVNSAIAMVEDVLSQLGHAPNDCREEPPYYGRRSWQVRKGSALVRIALVPRDEDMHLRTESVIMTLGSDVDEVHLFRRLLSINSELCGAAFALTEDRVLLFAERSTRDLDRSEVLELIRRTETYADHYDDILLAETGARP